MTTERLPMTRIKEILRLRWQQGRSVREAALAVGCSVGIVSKVASRALMAGLTFEAAEAMDEAALEERLYGRPAAPGDDRPRPDPVYVHQELKRVGVTLKLLHLEYLQEHPTGLRYTQFCEDYVGVRADNLSKRHLSRMVKSGQLERTHPENPNHPEQAYRTRQMTLPPVPSPPVVR